MEGSVSMDSNVRKRTENRKGQFVGEISSRTFQFFFLGIIGYHKWVVYFYFPYEKKSNNPFFHLNLKKIDSFFTKKLFADDI